MSTANNNLLSKPLLETIGPAHLDSRLYVVYNEQDYQMALSVLLTLVTKQSVGLGRADNTPDNEKPVSTPQAQALALKADKEDTATKAELTQAVSGLSDQLQDFVSLETLNQSIASITQALNSKQDEAQVSQAISTALAPINQALSEASNRLTVLEQQLSGGVATSQDLSQAIASLTQLITQSTTSLDQSKANRSELTNALSTLRTDLEDSINGLSGTTSQGFLSVAQDIGDINDSINSLNQALQGKLDSEALNSPEVASIIQAKIEEVLGDTSGFVRIGEAQW